MLVQHADVRSPSIVTWSVEWLFVQPVRLGLNLIALFDSKPRVPPMSKEWLRRHDAESGKHEG